MDKYYKVIKENPLWEIGAILHRIKDGNEDWIYEPIEDIWDLLEEGDTSLYAETVENSPKFFQRVYKSEGEKLIFKTAAQLKKIYSKVVK